MVMMVLVMVPVMVMMVIMLMAMLIAAMVMLLMMMQAACYGTAMPKVFCVRWLGVCVEGEGEGIRIFLTAYCYGSSN